jgi:predicted acetyltransferase
MLETSEVSVALASPADAPLLENLLELYIHDLSEIFAVEIGADGRFGYEHLARYWRERDRRFPFLIHVGGRIAGFVLVARGSPATREPGDLDVAEFFVLRRHRRSGVGRAAAFLLWSKLPGSWVVRVSDANAGALPFWSGVITDYTGGRFSRRALAGERHTWSIFEFQSVPKPAGA